MNAFNRLELASIFQTQSLVQTQSLGQTKRLDPTKLLDQLQLDQTRYSAQADGDSLSGYEEQQQPPPPLNAENVLDIVLSKRFGVNYQPIVEVQSGEIAGYQASASFRTQHQAFISAGRMFACLHKNPLLLFHTELEIKKLQIRHAPAGGLLMLDLDIDSLFEGGEREDNPFLLLFKQYAWSEKELVINVVENHHLADAYRSQRAIELLQASGTAVALEDLGVRWGMFSLSAFMDATVIKFNGASLQALDEKAANTMVDWLVSAARRIGVSVVMTGVDCCEQFDWAKRVGIDRVQGSLFAKQDIKIRHCAG